MESAFLKDSIPAPWDSKKNSPLKFVNRVSLQTGETSKEPQMGILSPQGPRDPVSPSHRYTVRTLH